MKSKCILSKINYISCISHKYISKRIKEENLPILRNHIPLFQILPESGEPMLFNEVSRIWQISKSSLSDIITKYENMRLIIKGACCEDKRSVYIKLTPQAVDIKHKLHKIEEEFLSLLLIDFSKNDSAIFEDNVDKALNNITKIL